MLKRRTEPGFPAQLRMKAEAHLMGGTAPATQGWPTGSRVLTLLHQLALVPDSADDALKLLHELQVHQVELDLQQEEAALAQQHLCQDRDRYFAMFDMAPLGYLTVDADGMLVEANRMARHWLGLAVDAAAGGAFVDLLAMECRQSFREGLRRLARGSKGEAMAVKAKANGSGLFLRAGPSPEPHKFLMAFMPLYPTSGH